MCLFSDLGIIPTPINSLTTVTLPVEAFANPTQLVQALAGIVIILFLAPASTPRAIRISFPSSPYQCLYQMWYLALYLILDWSC